MSTVERSIRDMVIKEVASAIKKEARAETRQHDHWSAAGVKWSSDEEDALLKLWRAFVYRAARDHRRTVGGIIARMKHFYKLGALCVPENDSC